MAKSVLDAIQHGCWDYEPEAFPIENFNATRALPGSDEKLKVLAKRIQEGLPLWHPGDRHSYEVPLITDDQRDPEIDAELAFENAFGNVDAQLEA